MKQTQTANEGPANNTASMDLAKPQHHLHKLTVDSGGSIKIATSRLKADGATWQEVPGKSLKRSSGASAHHL